VLPQVRGTLLVGLVLSFVTMLSVLSVPLMINPNSPTMITVDVAYRIPPGPYRQRQQRQRDRDQETRQDAEPQPGTQAKRTQTRHVTVMPQIDMADTHPFRVRAARGRSRGWRLYCVRKGGNPHRITCGGLAPALWRPTTDARSTPRAVRLARQAALGWRYWRSAAFDAG